MRKGPAGPVRGPAGRICRDRSVHVRIDVGGVAHVGGGVGLDRCVGVHAGLVHRAVGNGAVHGVVGTQVGVGGVATADVGVRAVPTADAGVGGVAAVQAGVHRRGVRRVVDDAL